MTAAFYIFSIQYYVLMYVVCESPYAFNFRLFVLLMVTKLNDNNTFMLDKWVWVWMFVIDLLIVMAAWLSLLWRPGYDLVLNKPLNVTVM